jgi:hypothetical protein
MYTTIPYARGDLFHLPEIGIMIQDRNNDFSDKLLSSYPWQSQLLNFGRHEIGYGESMIPGLGMLANSHLGLWNMKHYSDYEVQRHHDGTDSHYDTSSFLSTLIDDPGRGAYTHHSNVQFVAEKEIVAGSELFVNYGDEWFVARETSLGIIPGDNHFILADDLLRSFATEHTTETNTILTNDNIDNVTKEAYSRVLDDALQKDKRLRAALPNTVSEVPHAIEMGGTARYSAKESIQSTTWLEEHGACIDNIIVGTSTIPQAGRGAFATRYIPQGSRITATPVITIGREELYLWEQVRKTKDEIDSTNEFDVALENSGHQLLLNYCFGHVNSSLLFYPYSPNVNFINHGDSSTGSSNAYIRWSDHPYHKSDWLNSTMDEMKSRKYTGLMFDIVATRDIAQGEEILIDYGKDWTESWDRHVQECDNMTSSSNHRGIGEDDDGDGDDNNNFRFAIGTVVSKMFVIGDTGAHQAFSGVVTSYDPETMLYTVKYEDDDYEVLNEMEIADIVDEQRRSSPMVNKLGLPTISDYNIVENFPTVLTVDEQLDEPYPSHIMNVCKFLPPYDVPTHQSESGCGENVDVTEDGYCRSRWKGDDTGHHIYRCTITSRVHIGGLDWYTALIEVRPDTNPPTPPITHLVEFIPRHAILFADKPYTKDQYATGVFRHEINLPDGLIPLHWMDY